MNVWALILVKGAENRKSRLATHLCHQERVELVRHMRNHVLATVGHCRRVGGIVVMSPERDGIPSDIEVIPDQGRDVNDSLVRAVSTLRERAVEWVLVLPADLPWLTTGDLDAILNAADRQTLVMAPDHQGQGTNGLCLPVDIMFRFCFGEGSRQAHTQEAARLGVDVHMVRTPGLVFDLDRPVDLERYRNPKFNPHTEAARS